MDKTQGMKRNARMKAAGLAAILWAAMQAGAAWSAPPEAGAGERAATEKPKKETVRAQKQSGGKALPGKRGKQTSTEAPAEAVLCDGVPFAPTPTDTSGAEGSKR
ncbi:MAG: hypothetical protein Q8L56_02670 [Rhodocyclaceae bacterium]|nr:hypothetical protein [Rhodocyclaceae bacterium]